MANKSNENVTKVWMTKKAHRLAQIEATLRRMKVVDAIDSLMERGASEDAKRIYASELSKGDDTLKYKIVQSNLGPIHQEGLAEKLKELKKILEANLITEEEYKTKKSEILSRI